jgi:hypothetical protein
MTQQTAGRAGSQARDPWRYRWIVLGIATFTQAASGFFVGGIGALGVLLQSALVAVVVPILRGVRRTGVSIG